jgi:hypothetical protein
MRRSDRQRVARRARDCAALAEQKNGVPRDFEQLKNGMGNLAVNGSRAVRVSKVAPSCRSGNCGMTGHSALHPDLVLLLDVPGLSSLVKLMKQGDLAGEAVCTVLGPVYRNDSPWRAAGAHPLRCGAGTAALARVPKGIGRRRPTSAGARIVRQEARARPRSRSL